MRSLRIITFITCLASLTFSGAARADHFHPILKGQRDICAGGPRERVFEVEITHGHWSLGKDGTGKDNTITAWMFNNTMPGEVFEACQGDTVIYRVTNNSPKDEGIKHGFDPHSLNIGAEAFQSFAPGETRDVKGVVDIPGIFMHHCAAGPELTDAHIVMGMGSATVVYPRKQILESAVNVVVVVGATSDGKYFFNGSMSNKPIVVHKGTLVRLWVQSVAHGTNTIHVIGENDTTFYPGWDKKSNRFITTGTSQGFTLSNGNGVIVEFTPKSAGKRLIVDHDKLDQLNSGFALPITVIE